MKGVVITVIVMFLLMWGCATAVMLGSKKESTSQTINVVEAGPAADGLDLQAVGELVKTAKNGQDLERKLNEPNGINNLDLNDDGNVDFISVTEFGNKRDEFGFSLTTEPEKGEVQEIATINIFKEQDGASVRVSGSENVYGSGNHYHYHNSGANLTNWLLFAWLISDRDFYRPRYRWGYYPSYYRPYRSVTRTVYKTRTKPMLTNSNYRKMAKPLRTQSIPSPNKGATANSGIKKSLAKPTSSQKSFQVRNSAKPVRSGGFGRNSSGNATSSSRTKSSSSNSARSRSSSRGFGGRGK